MARMRPGRRCGWSHGHMQPLRKELLPTPALFDKSMARHWRATGLWGRLGGQIGLGCTPMVQEGRTMAKGLSRERLRELARNGAAEALSRLRAEIVAIERTFP